MRRIVLLALLLIGCSRGDYRAARGAYNDGVVALEGQDWARAQTAFLQARSEAGVDPELRWRAAFNVGLAYAGQAAQVAAAQPPELEKAHELYGNAAGWFQDAVRLRPDDAEARANLEIVRARQQAIGDQLAAGEKALEHKLDKLIEGQREIRDGARALLVAARADAAANPLAIEDEARGLATRERTLLADAGVVVDLAGAELDGLTAKPEEERTPEDQVRQVQLEGLELWMQIARSALSDTRRMLDEGKSEGAHDRAEEAVEGLKRAREQLLDPVAVLRAVATDQLEVAQQGAYLAHAAAEARKLDGAAVDVPAWLTAEHLGGRQTDARSRLDELVTRLRAAAEAPPAPRKGAAPTDIDTDLAAPPAPDDPQAAQRERLIARVKLALPDLDAASAAMTKSRDALTTGALEPASAAQAEALVALSRAIEHFLDIRGVIDLAHAEQQQIVALLAGEGETPAGERGKLVGEGLERNLGRMAQLEGLFADEKDAAAATPSDPNDPAAADKQQQALAQLARAEELRVAALTALRELGAGGKARPPLDVAKDGQARIEELRALFFSIIEHLEELIRQQGETRDDSATAQGLDDDGRAPLLPGLTTRQGEHRQIGQAIADALAAQADAMAQQPAPAQPGAPDPAKLAQAAEEVRAALVDMDDASTVLGRAADPAQQVSVDLLPLLESQQGALDHLEAALAILRPPQEQQQQDQQQEQQQEQQQQQQDQQQQQQQDQSVERRREQVREQEAQRRREREQRQRSDGDPVEKDW